MKQIVLTGLIILGNNFLFCQSDTPEKELTSERKQAITISYNPLPMIGLYNNLHLRHTNEKSPDGIKFGLVLGEFGVKGVFYELKKSGMFSVAYGRQLSKEITLTASLSYLQLSQKWDLYIDENSPHYFTERFHLFLVMPGMQFDYIREKNVALFSAIEVGINYLWHDIGGFEDVLVPQKRTSFAFQIWVSGFDVIFMDRFRARFCLGFGTKGLLEFGLGYRF
ncbi:MAG: hypothetical protein FWE63_00880 [Bacteroidales bacterium]|nr:hypothetical protein [Bacteroidales bacterium]